MMGPLTLYFAKRFNIFAIKHLPRPKNTFSFKYSMCFYEKSRLSWFCGNTANIIKLSQQ